MELGGISAAIASGIIPVGVLAAAGWKWLKEWRAANPKGESWQDRDARRLELARDRLDRNSEAYLDRLEREMKRYEEEGEELRSDRDRGWDLARYWRGKADNLWYKLAAAHFKLKLDMPPALPDLEEPIPRPPDNH